LAHDKVAFVTGGSSGIGAATVRKFLQKNIKVGFLDKDQVLGNKLASEFSKDDVFLSKGMF
jgi:NADP-dependent 3-hydroxy acid dehydrogenase YdfG